MLTPHNSTGGAASLNSTDLKSSIIGYICKGCIARILKDKFIPTDGKALTAPPKNAGPEDPKDFTPDSDYDNDSPVAPNLATALKGLKPGSAAKTEPANHDTNTTPKCLICGATLKLIPSSGCLTLKNQRATVTAADAPVVKNDRSQTTAATGAMYDQNVPNMKRDFAVSMINCPMCDRKSLRAVDATTVEERIDHRHLVCGGDSFDGSFSMSQQSTEVREMLKKLEMGATNQHDKCHDYITKSMIIAQEDRLFSPIPIKMLSGPRINNQPATKFPTFQYPNSPKTFSHHSPIDRVKSPTALNACPRCHLPFDSSCNVSYVQKPFAPLVMPTILATQVNKIRSIMNDIKPVIPYYSQVANLSRPQMMGDYSTKFMPCTIPIQQPLLNNQRSIVVQSPFVAPRPLSFNPTIPRPSLTMYANPNTIGSIQRCSFTVPNQPRFLCNTSINTQSYNAPVGISAPTISYCQPNSINRPNYTCVPKICPTCKVPFTPAPSPIPLPIVTVSPNPYILSQGIGSKPPSYQYATKCPGCGRANDIPAPPFQRLCGICGKYYECNDSHDNVTQFQPGCSNNNQARVTNPVMSSDIPTLPTMTNSMPVPKRCGTCGQVISNQFIKPPEAYQSNQQQLNSLPPSMPSVYPSANHAAYRCALCGQSLRENETFTSSTSNGLSTDPISSWNVCAACQRQTYPHFNGPSSMMVPRQNLIYNSIPSRSINLQMFYPSAPQSFYARAVPPGSFMRPIFRSIVPIEQPYQYAYFHIEELAKLLIHMIDLMNPKHEKKSIEEVLERCRVYFEGIVEFKETRDTNSRQEFNKGILKNDNNAVMLNTLRNRIKEKERIVYRKLDSKDDFEKSVQALLGWYSANPLTPKADVIRQAKQIYDTTTENNRDMASVANEVIKDMSIGADPVPETLRLLRTCLKKYSDLTSKNIVELTYLTYNNLIQAKAQGHLPRATPSIHKPLSGNIHIPVEYESEIVKNVCTLQGKYPFVSARTVMFYSLDMYKKFLEGPLPQMSATIDNNECYEGPKVRSPHPSFFRPQLTSPAIGSLNPSLNDPLKSSLSDLIATVKSLKENVDRFNEFMRLLEQKGDIAKIAIKKYEGKQPPAANSASKNSNLFSKEYILEYFNKRNSRGSQDSKISTRSNLSNMNDNVSTGSYRGKKKSNLKKSK